MSSKSNFSQTQVKEILVTHENTFYFDIIDETLLEVDTKVSQAYNVNDENIKT